MATKFVTFWWRKNLPHVGGDKVCQISAATKFVTFRRRQKKICFFGMWHYGMLHCFFGMWLRNIGMWHLVRHSESRSEGACVLDMELWAWVYLAYDDTSEAPCDSQDIESYSHKERKTIDTLQ